tara:strand:- start:4835 stop:4957 length:123 start_codon:yes stop_codon:yes gene_type:complete
MAIGNIARAMPVLVQDVKQCQPYRELKSRFSKPIFTPSDP